MASESGVIFINKCAKSTSLSRSDGAERARIFSHVQLNQQSQPVNVKAQFEEQSDGPDTAIVWQVALSRKEATQRSKSNPQSKSRRGRRRQNQNSQSRDHSPLSAIGLATYDPFETTAAPITPYMNRVLEFCRFIGRITTRDHKTDSLYLDSSGMLYRAFPDRFLADASRQCTLAYASEDAVALNAILCTVTGMLYSHGRQVREGLHAMYFKGQAIHHLKQELSKTDDKAWKMSTLYAVSLLLWVEVCFPHICITCEH
jgi:hypothetical protein